MDSRGQLVLPAGVVDLDRGEVVRDGVATALTPLECKLLGYLSERAGAAVDHAEVLRDVWGYHPESRSLTVPVAVRRLRAKIERDPGQPEVLRTVRGRGWRLVLGALAPEVEPPHGNLGVSPDAFFGREKELATLASAGRLVTLLGPAGVGKTRLATELASRWVASGACVEAWFCDLSAAGTPDDVADAVGRALDLRLSGHDPRAQVGRALASRRDTVLVLDNFEQIADHAPVVVDPWLRAAPGVRFVVTSRERLRIAGERVFGVGPLEPAAARALFLDRASAVVGPLEADEAVLDEVLDLLDHLPLAIELAAARMTVFSLPGLRGRLADRFEVLRGERGPDRQSSLQGALDWSWSLLTSDERRHLAACSVFVGGFDLDAAQAVLGDDERAVARLIDQSLVRRLVPAGSEDLRFDLYASIRDYAAARLAEDPDAQAQARRRHAAWYARRADRSPYSQPLTGAGAHLGPDDLLDRANLDAAVGYALDAGDDEVAARAAIALLHVANLAGTVLPAARLGTHVLGRGVAGTWRVRLALSAAEGWFRARRFDEALALAEEALALADDDKSRSRALNLRGLARADRGDRHGADDDHRAALAIDRALGDAGGAASMLGNLASNALAEGRVDEAVSLSREALSLALDAKNHREEGFARCRLANCSRIRGDLPAASTQFDLARAAFAAIGARQLAGVMLANRALVSDAQGDLDGAAEGYVAALALHRATGDRGAEGVTLGNLGDLWARRGDAARARGHLEDAVVVLAEVGWAAAEGAFSGTLARLVAQDGDIERAWALLAHGESLLKRSGMREEIAKNACMRGHVALAAGDRAAAEAALADARTEAGSMGLGPTSPVGVEIDALSAAIEDSRQRG